MICRPERDGWLLITQIAHAWMAGEVAAAWGNDEFATPAPREAVVLATRLHDLGWIPWDEAPRLDRSGRPVDFLDLSLEETIPIWRQAVRQVCLINPFAALLVSLHATTIYRRRLERGAEPPEQSTRARQMLEEQALLRAEIASGISAHPIYGPEVAPDRLAERYRWLRACDVLSLVGLSARFAPRGETEAVPGRAPGESKTIRYERNGRHTVLLDPWPFALPRFQLVVEARYLAREVFADQAQFHSQLAAAPWRPFTVTYQPLRLS